MKKTKRVRKPSWFIYYIIGPIVILFIKIKYKLNIKRTKIKEGSLIIQPHRSYFDILIGAYSVYPTRVNFVSTSLWFRNKFLKLLLDSMGVIPKNQFKNDINAIMKITEALKKKYNVLMYAEGQMSAFGTSLSLPHGLNKLIAKIKPNVYFIKSNGAYLSSPRWNPKFRRGYWDSEVVELLSNDHPENYTIENIDKLLNECYSNSNDFKYMENDSKFKIKKKSIAAGLEHMLTVCPDCKEVLPFSEKDNVIVCDKCGYKLEFLPNSYYFKDQSKFKHLGELFDYERNEFNELVSNNFKLEDDCYVSYYDDKFVKHELGEYKLVLENDTFMLINDKETISVEKKDLVNIVLNFNKGIELPLEKETYIVDFINKKNIFLYWNYINR